MSQCLFQSPSPPSEDWPDLTCPREPLVEGHAELRLPNNREEFIHKPERGAPSLKSNPAFSSWFQLPPVRTESPQGGSGRLFEIAKTALTFRNTASIVVPVVTQAILTKGYLFPSDQFHIQIFTSSKIPAQFCTLAPFGWGEEDCIAKQLSEKEISNECQNLAWGPKLREIQDLASVCIPPGALPHHFFLLCFVIPVLK